MRSILIILITGIALGSYAQDNRNCVTPVSNFIYQQQFGSISSKKDEMQMLNQAKRFARENCLSTEQVKKIAELFQNDFNRLAFVQSAYDNTTDKDNFYEIYNSFTFFSNVFRLHDYVMERRGNTKPVVDIPPTSVMSFPNFEYPDYRKYFGKIGCKNIINDQEFINLAEKVFKENSEDRKLNTALGISAYNCLQVAQVMKIASLLQNESSRLDFLKKSYQKVFDPDNYKFAAQVFTSDNFKNEFNTFIGGGAVTVITTNPPCEINTQDFAAIKNQISKQSFTNTKLNLAKQLIQDKKCYKTAQIIELIALFPYSDSKMEIAKFAYDYTTDKDNYTKIADSFSFSRDKDDFLKFLQSKR